MIKNYYLIIFLILQVGADFFNIQVPQLNTAYYDFSLSVDDSVFFASSSSDRVDIYNASSNSWSTAMLSSSRYLITTKLDGLVFFASLTTSRIIDIYNISSKTMNISYLSQTTSYSGATSFSQSGLAFFICSNGFIDIYYSSNKSIVTIKMPTFNGVSSISFFFASDKQNTIYIQSGGKIITYNVTSGIWRNTNINLGNSLFSKAVLDNINIAYLGTIEGTVTFSINLVTLELKTYYFNLGYYVDFTPLSSNNLIFTTKKLIIDGISRSFSQFKMTKSITTFTSLEKYKLVFIRSPDSVEVFSYCGPGLALEKNTLLCIPIPAGYYANDYSVSVLACPPGNFCPEGTNNPLPCPIGTYYNNTGIKNYTECLICPEKYYCGEQTSNPIICPNGNYCPIGSSNPINCPSSTYNPNQGLNNISGCLTCPGGYYCQSGTNTPSICPAGYYCPNGSSYTINCPVGYYCPSNGLIAPIICPVGYYCPNNQLINAVLCSPGYYCPEGSLVQRSCLPGNYCFDGKYQLPCPIGKYCPNVRMITPNDCPAGYYCPNIGASSLCILDTNKGFTCPDDQAVACPSGKYSPFTGKNSSSDCISCQEGYYCPNTAMTSFLSYPCQKGFICKTGYENQIQTPAGTYAPNNLMSNGLKCPLRFYCPTGSISPLPCKQGTYCPEGISEPFTCQTGMYNDFTNSSSITDCVKCPEGTYNNFGTGSISICKPCAPGYYCPPGTSLPQPCSANYYCPDGRKMIPCPAGSFYESVGASEVSYCKLCQKGYYCPGGGTTAVTCTPGSFSQKLGGIFCETCPEGSFCPFGAIEPLICPMNTYASKGSPACTPCDNGQYTETVGSSVCVDCSGNRFQISGWWCMSSYDRAIFIIVWVGSIISGIATIKKIRDFVKERLDKLNDAGLRFTWERFIFIDNIKPIPRINPSRISNHIKNNSRYSEQNIQKNNVERYFKNIPAKPQKVYRNRALNVV